MRDSSIRYNKCTFRSTFRLSRKVKGRNIGNPLHDIMLYKIQYIPWRASSTTSCNFVTPKLEADQHHTTLHRNLSTSVI